MRDVMSDFTQYCFRKILPIQLLLLGICFPSKYFKMFSWLFAASLKHEHFWKERVASLQSNHQCYNCYIYMSVFFADVNFTETCFKHFIVSKRSQFCCRSETFGSLWSCTIVFNSLWPDFFVAWLFWLFFLHSLIFSTTNHSFFAAGHPAVSFKSVLDF